MESDVVPFSFVSFRIPFGFEVFSLYSEIIIYISAFRMETLLATSELTHNSR